MSAIICNIKIDTTIINVQKVTKLIFKVLVIRHSREHFKVFSRWFLNSSTHSFKLTPY